MPGQQWPRVRVLGSCFVSTAYSPYGRREPSQDGYGIAKLWIIPLPMEKEVGNGEVGTKTTILRGRDLCVCVGHP